MNSLRPGFLRLTRFYLTAEVTAEVTAELHRVIILCATLRQTRRNSAVKQTRIVFISPKLDHPFRSKLNHPELPVKEGVKIGLIFG